MSFTSFGRIKTPVLDIGYESAGDPGGTPVILLHGFPYDVRAFDDVAPILAGQDAFVLAPYLRGFGPTRFLKETTIRSGQQAALGQDLLDFMDALNIEQAVVAGYDWGGRAACIVAALDPGRVAGLVSVGGYNMHNLARSGEPASPEWERSYWYQYYFHSERGRRGLEQNRDELCELLWRTWSPTWAAAGQAFPASAPSLHNPDFVDVVIHSYRHRYGLADGDPRYQRFEDLIAQEPRIAVPTVVLESGDDGVGGPGALAGRDKFTGPYSQSVLPGIGHNVPQENPAAFARAVVSLFG
ncbi:MULTISPECIES: alpha/beta fold hydrolase [unclassified Arthrobacter]|uniref:alpha/beta fold hydrolase n=1 Tax=unclassified Arthrobacter TaxID=235627 RepID=UPI002DF99BFA|nr:MULTISPECIES: alpha/beta hydrolase [unclassified Arthrobacter]MEC5191473.1 pimeloyl-ACP methyl ester carboxylesterase [Arthrobacter sp. MP_M4]MEC5203056.1 pimeloyl-ACP methyl ester carboxylesterase [Arthrobacter sp. MP_M7]